MNKIYNLFLLLLIFTYGCKSRKDINNIDINNQSIDSFNMNMFTTEGKKMLSIISPKSNFDKVNNIFNLKKTTIYLFKGNIKEYKITSDNAKVTDNKLVELYGNVAINTLLQEENNLNANYFWWDVNSSEYLLKDNVVFENKSITLSSNKAIMNKSNNIIEFFEPVKYIIKKSNNKNNFEIKSENAYYNVDNKSLFFSSMKKRVRSKLYF